LTIESSDELRTNLAAELIRAVPAITDVAAGDRRSILSTCVDGLVHRCELQV
jgi:hypothetical protein